jgi:hypothetical protein
LVLVVSVLYRPGTIYYTRRQKNEFGVMDPNVKLLIKKITKQHHAEIKEGFTSHEAAFTKLLDEVAATEHIRDARLANLEEAAAPLDEALAAWRPEVDASITSVKLELSKLNIFSSHEAKASSGSQPGLIATGSAPASTSATDGPVEHHVNSSHRDCEFGHVVTQTHDPVKGTVYPSFAPSKFPARLVFPHGVESLSAPNPLGEFPQM